MTQIPHTPENAALVHLVEKRMRADTTLLNARAGMWKTLGIGGMLLGAGLGLGAILFGASYLTDPRTQTQKIADALAIAFDKTTLKAEGMVAVKEGGTVALTDREVRIANPTVSLEPGAKVQVAEGGTVGIARGAKVGVEGEVGVAQGSKVGIEGAAPYRPSPEQMRVDRTSAGGGAVVTNFTIFKNVRYGKGVVTSGWEYTSNEQATPSAQFCYYAEAPNGADDTNVNVFIARNNTLLTSSPMRQKIGYRTAAQQCMWFDGSPTRDY